MISVHVQMYNIFRLLIGVPDYSSSESLNVRSEISREKRQKRTDKKVASKGHRRDRQKNGNRVGEGTVQVH